MTTISKDNKFLRSSTFSLLSPGSTTAPVELLIKATNDSIRYAQGFISASLHRSIDGTKVTMYAQWRGY